MPWGGEPHTMAMIADSGLRSALAVCRALPFHTVPTPALPPHNAGQQLAPFSQLRPHWPPPAPPSDHGRAGAGSNHAATRAPIPAPTSASRKAAADPSSSNGHTPDGSFACPHYAALPVARKVPAKIPLYTVMNLALVWYTPAAV
jgi:hypothetical protein